MKNILVLGAGGFIGNHLVNRLKDDNCFVRAADIKHPEFSKTKSDEFILCDLRNLEDCKSCFLKKEFDEVYHLAADMGGALYINSGKNDANVMSNSMLMNINVIKCCMNNNIKKIFFPSSACIYNSINNYASCIEEEAYPAFPDNEYGWAKLFTERMYQSYTKNFGIDIKIARFHSIVGPESQWKGGKEKAHSALAGKVALLKNNGIVNVIGDGTQIRTFLYIQDCIDAVLMLMESNINEPINIGSNELISIKDYVLLLKEISNKNFHINFIDGPTGVNRRECSIDKIYKMLSWKPKTPLIEATKITYSWIQNQIIKS